MLRCRPRLASRMARRAGRQLQGVPCGAGERAGTGRRPSRATDAGAVRASGSLQDPDRGHPGYEAEDVIGTLAQRVPPPVAIVSGDRDLFQLVRDPDIHVLFPRRGVSEMDVVNEGYIENKYGIPGRTYGDFAVLRGDPSDGLPGVRGIGEKLASALISRYGDLQGVIEAAEAGEPGVALGKVRRELDYVRRAAQVVAIPTELPIPKVDLSRPRSAPDDSAFELAEQWGLGGAFRRLVAALTGT